jgi:cell division protein FtsL
MAARRRVKPRGRSWLALALLAFVLVAIAIVWRRGVGMRQTREVEALLRQRLDLEAQRAGLEADIRAALSLARIAPLAERRLGMHVAADSQLVYLARPGAPR